MVWYGKVKGTKANVKTSMHEEVIKQTHNIYINLFQFISIKKIEEKLKKLFKFCCSVALKLPIKKMFSESIKQFLLNLSYTWANITFKGGTVA